MIVDAHNHVLDVPWALLAPDLLAGQAEKFLHYMDANQVKRAVIVAVPEEYDPQNNQTVLKRAREHPDRFQVLANVHLDRADALDRVKELLASGDAKHLVGISHYLAATDEAAWMRPSALWDLIAQNRFAVNLSLRPPQHRKLRPLAKAYAATPFLISHLGSPTTRGEPNPEWNEVLQSADAPNIYMKISGFAYATKSNWEYPYADVLPYIERIAKAFGAERMLWGSDYPPTMRFMTYRQSLEMVRTHCSFLTEPQKALVLGGTAQRLFNLPGE